MWQERITTGCNALRVFVVIFGAEGILEGLVVMVLSSAPIHSAMYYKGIAEQGLSPNELEKYMRVYAVEVSMGIITSLLFFVSAVINAILFAGALLFIPDLVLFSAKCYLWLYSWMLPLYFLWSIMWSIGGMIEYPGLALFVLCVVMFVRWMVVRKYKKQVKRILAAEEE